MNKEEERFHQLWRRCSHSDKTVSSTAIFAEIKTHYAQPGRHYHVLDHILFCLQRYDLSTMEMGANDAVEMALWFHDIIYIPAAGDNEAKSAEWFAERAEHDLSPGFIKDVERLILITKHNHVMPVSDDEMWITDVDLNSFGLPWPEYQADSDKVRAEFPFLSEAEYARNQSRFLQELESRPRIYLTDFFNSRYETQARYNIARQLQRLAAIV